MKKIFSTAILLATTSFYAQEGKVGIGNTDPKATLDVTGNAATTTTADGIIAPRLTGNQLAAKDAVYLVGQTGAQVYITAAATTPAGKTINVNAPGYYYFDGTVWQKISNGTGSGKFVDGTTVTDAVYTGGNVGIGTINPTKKLEVNGDFKNSSFETVNSSSGAYHLLDFAQASNGSASDWQLYVNGVGSIKDGGLNFYDGTTSVMLLDGANDRVGIGTTDPTKKLDINGELRIRTIPNSAGNQSILTVDANGNVSKTNAGNPSLLSESTGSVATTNVDVTFTTPSTDNNIDLGLTQTITIPANTMAKIFINYSVPVGFSSFTDAKGYYGIRFLKDGIEQDAGSRKSSFFNAQSANMTTISNTYFEVIPASASIQTITYSLKGYVELNSMSVAASHTFRFNMWQPTGNNYNWGKATLTLQAYY